MVAVVSLIGTPTTVDAQISWLNASGGLFETGSNWSHGSVPGPDDQLFFGQTGNYEVGFSNSHTVAGIFVTSQAKPTFRLFSDSTTDRTLSVNGDISITLNGGLTLDSEGGPGRMFVDNSGFDLFLNGFRHEPAAGQLTLCGGAMLTSTNAFLAQSPDSAARLLITGDGSEWTMDELNAGFNGPVEIDVESGGKLTSSQSAELRSAVVNVSGMGTDSQPSSWTSLGNTTDIGLSGGAEINISEGAHVVWSPMGVVYMTDLASSTVVCVSGFDAAGNPSTLRTGNLAVSVFGWATEITIENGARVDTMETQFGNTGTAEILVSGSDASGNPSQWTSSSLTIIRGSVSILDGARFEVDGLLSILNAGKVELIDGVFVADRIEDSTTNSFRGCMCTLMEYWNSTATKAISPGQTAPFHPVSIGPRR